MKFQSSLRQLSFSLVLMLVGTLSLTAQQTGSQQATGDPPALAIVESSLAALSGASSWSNVQATHLTGAMSVPSSKGPISSPIEWEDIWKHRNIWYLHKMGTGNSERDLVQSPGRGKMLRREDKSLVKVSASATLPPVEIPGAFLSVILKDSTCSVRSMSPVHDEKGDEAKSDVVRITCAAPEAPGGVESQVWTFSHATQLPLSVSVVRQDLRRAGVRFRRSRVFQALSNGRWPGDTRFLRTRAGRHDANRNSTDHRVSKSQPVPEIRF